SPATAMYCRRGTGSSPVADAALGAHSKQQGGPFAGIGIPVIRHPRAAADHALLCQRYVGTNPAAPGKRRGKRFTWSYDPERNDRRYCRQSLPSLKLTVILALRAPGLSRPIGPRPG